MPEENPGVVDKEKLHPERMKRFMVHLSAAAIRAQERSAKKNEVRQRLDKMKSVSLNKRSTKQMIESEFGDFESTVHEIIKDEEKILEEQRRETKQISELKRMVEELSKKLISLGREYAGELEAKDRKILDLREALAHAHIKISESGEDRKAKIAEIEKKLKEKQSVERPPSRSEVLGALEEHLTSLEQRHTELKKRGRHSKKDLDRVKKLIDTHKQKIKTLKK
jgi:chromosome segregation ATPase